MPVQRLWQLQLDVDSERDNLLITSILQRTGVPPVCSECSTQRQLLPEIMPAARRGAL